LRLCRQGTACVAGVDGAGGLDEQDRSFLLCSRAVLDAARDDEQLALVEFDVAVTKLDREVSLGDEEEVVVVALFVPDELGLDLQYAYARPRTSCPCSGRSATTARAGLPASPGD